MVTLERAKQFLRIEHDFDDELISSFITAAEKYVKSACGKNVDLDEERAEIVTLMITSDYYECRTPYGQEKYSQNVSTILTQLRLETEE